MAVGDAAAAAGLPVVPSTKDLRLGYNDINALADALAGAQSTLAGRLTPLEAATAYTSGVCTFLNGWTDAGTNLARVGKTVTLNLRVTRPDNSFGSGTAMLSVPVGFRPVVVEVGSAGYLSGATVQIGALTLQSDGQARFYFTTNSADRTITGTITFLAP